MKNPFDVEPVHFMKKKESKCAIYCNKSHGPVFGDVNGDIAICNDSNNNVNWISPPSKSQYELHKTYNKTLYVNSSWINYYHYFSVSDYEVFCIDDYKENLKRLCKYPDIAWEYVENKDISIRSLNEVDDKEALLKDLNVAYCNNNVILKVTNYLEGRSEVLKNTHILNKDYYSYIYEWTKDDKWRLIYRASEHEYTAKSFHECCDDKGPTLIVIKSSEGWIFGGYTTQSWKYVDELYGCIYNNMI